MARRCTPDYDKRVETRTVADIDSVLIMSRGATACAFSCSIARADTLYLLVAINSSTLDGVM